VTQIDIDEDALDRAMALSRARTKEDAERVHQAEKEAR
jgi:hypothetical protein